MIIYIVTTSPYGDRAVKGVFEDRDQAILMCALLENDDPLLEEFDTEAIKIGGSKKPLAEWTLLINAEGVVRDMGLRYTFDQKLKFDDDLDGSVIVTLTLDTDVPADKVKEIALNHVRNRKK